MFEFFSLSEDEALTYEMFVVLLSHCEVDSGLFRGLLKFATDVVEAGVQVKLNGRIAEQGTGTSSLVSKMMGSHVFDDGSPAWRESVEAAFVLCDEDAGGTICKTEMQLAVAKYPLISQLMRLPVAMSDVEQMDYMGEMYDMIDSDGSGSIDSAEWLSFFCPDRQAVPKPIEWDADANPACAKVTGFIFDCDGTVYQPSGLIPGAASTLAWIERSGFQYVLLSNTGAQPFDAVYDKLAALGMQPNAKPLPPGRAYTAADAQVEFMMSDGQLPAGSRMLILAPDERCATMLRTRNHTLFDSWEIATTMDVDTAKSWSMHAKARLEWETARAASDAARAVTGEAAGEALTDVFGEEAMAAERGDSGAVADTVLGEPPPKVAVVFFHDGRIASDRWSYELIHAMTILLTFGAEFIYTATDPVNPSIDARYPGEVFPMPGPGMFVKMLEQSMPPLSSARCFCCGKGGNVGREFMIDRAVHMLQEQGHSGERDSIMVVGDRFDTDVRAAVLAGIKSCLLDTGAHTREMSDAFPTDIPSYWCNSIAELPPRGERGC